MCNYIDRAMETRLRGDKFGQRKIVRVIFDDESTAIIAQDPKSIIGGCLSFDVTAC